jgi:hypothetical protein
MKPRRRSVIPAAIQMRVPAVSRSFRHTLQYCAQRHHIRRPRDAWCSFRKLFHRPRRQCRCIVLRRFCALLNLDLRGKKWCTTSASPSSDASFGLHTLFVSTQPAHRKVERRTTTMRVTKPRARRYPFNATVELTHFESGIEVRGQTNDLSLFGCRVNALNPMAVGSSVRIRISHQSRIFTALGRVVHAGAKGRWECTSLALNKPTS